MSSSRNPGAEPAAQAGQFLSRHPTWPATPRGAGRDRMICVRAIVDVLTGKRPQGVINQEVLKV